MFFNFIICIVITQVLGVPVLNTFYTQLKGISKKKCPSLENSILLQPQPFLKDCDPELFNITQLSEQYENPILCSMYSSVFENMCETLGQNNNYDVSNLPDVLEGIKTRNVEEVCSLLSNITEVVLRQPLISQVVHSRKCLRICSDYDNLKPACLWTSFMWEISRAAGTQKKISVLKTTPLPPLPKNIDMAPISPVPHPSNNVEPSLPTKPKNLNSNINPQEKSSAENKISAKETVNKITSSAEKAKDSDPIKTNNEILNETKSDPINMRPDPQEPKANEGDKLPNKENPSKVETPKQQDVEAPKEDTQEPKDKEGDKLTKEEDQSKVKTGKDQGVEPPQEDINYEGEEGDDEFENLNELPPKQTKTKDDEIHFEDKNVFENVQSPKSSEVKQKPVEVAKPREIDEDSSSLAANFQNQNIDDSDSYFFSYFMMVCVIFICGYVAYHNKQKILALVLEGRKGRRPSRSRRPNSANYRKLDTTLEEAVTSSCNKDTTQVIY